MLEWWVFWENAYFKCSLVHSEQSKMAMVGYGFDRHRFALSNEAKVLLCENCSNFKWNNFRSKIWVVSYSIFIVPNRLIYQPLCYRGVWAESVYQKITIFLVVDSIIHGELVFATCPVILIRVSLSQHQIRYTQARTLSLLLKKLLIKLWIITNKVIRK